jgi:cell division protein FtsI (penicillin-binding protein 3)
LRSSFAFVLFSAFALVFLGRLVFLDIVVAEEYSKDAKEVRTANIPLSPRRGTIYDRNGVVLATSIDATTIYADPTAVTDVKGESAQLAQLLGGQAADYEEQLSGEGTFAWVKRKVDVELADKVAALELPGINFAPDTKRFYPNESVGGQVLGIVNVDNVGVSGIELYYNDILQGTPGVRRYERGAKGLPIPGGEVENTPAVNGQDIIISLDITMQAYLEQRLVQEVGDLEGKGGNAMVMDGGTGEILACASLPYLNPGDTSHIEQRATELRGITDIYEPGSIFKTAAVAAILEQGVMTPDDTLFCPAFLTANGYEIYDAHARGAEVMSLRQILDRSSNIGISLAAEKLGFDILYQKIIDYGLNDETGVDFPGEAQGLLAEGSEWSLVQSYNVSFGQGVSVTPLQMVRFYGALINEGSAITPHFLIKKLDAIDQPLFEEKQIIANTAMLPVLTSMLETVVTNGTATDAAIEGYCVAGKTGTAQIPNTKATADQGYLEGVYNISFVGFLPHSSSQLVCFVGATEVPGERKVTAAFRDIMAYAIDRYKIVPYEG